MVCQLQQPCRHFRTLGQISKWIVESPSTTPKPRCFIDTTQPTSRSKNFRNRRFFLGFGVGSASITGGLLYDEEHRKTIQRPFVAAQRCARIGKAAALSIIDYKRTFSRGFSSDKDRQQAYSDCHTRSAKRVLSALLLNGGIYIKLGQHVSSLIIVPKEWSTTFRPLQDKCTPSNYDDLQTLFKSDLGESIDELFETFDPEPIGVASLAQVHVANYRKTGEMVAVKVQHPSLREFAQIDMRTVEIIVEVIKRIFPQFEFSWLAGEMRENLPKEMDFVNEADNGFKAARNFANTSTSLYIPDVVQATERILIMEYIQGGRVDDKYYLAHHEIDRNKVALELQRIFSQMVHLDGWFHADPHPGNLLIRPAPTSSRSPYNFEIVLLDHGLYFDLDQELRLNYSKMWLSLIDGTVEDRKKYAQLAGNIGPDLYPVFEVAITGHVPFNDELDFDGIALQENTLGAERADTNAESIMDAIMNQGGLIESILQMLRVVPRRILMVLKLNDLTRHLDHTLDTTHSESRIFLILARYCSLAVWREEKRQFWGQLRNNILEFSAWGNAVHAFWSYHRIWTGFRLLELWMDFNANLIKNWIWLRTIIVAGRASARWAAAGL